LHHDEERKARGLPIEAGLLAEADYLEDDLSTFDMGSRRRRSRST
jgi:hypothetical protein